VSCDAPRSTFLLKENLVSSRGDVSVPLFRERESVFVCLHYARITRLCVPAFYGSRQSSLRALDCLGEAEQGKVDRTYADWKWCGMSREKRISSLTDFPSLISNRVYYLVSYCVIY
jgi:hypothetical protein